VMGTAELKTKQYTTSPLTFENWSDLISFVQTEVPYCTRIACTLPIRPPPAPTRV